MKFYIYILLALGTSLQTINGQTIRSHIICDVAEVIVSVNSSGVIQHVQRDSSISCTLLLSGFVSGSYVSIPGIREQSPDSFGCKRYAKVIINNALYCVRGVQLNSFEAVHLTNNQLNMTLTASDEPDFELNYYSNVAVCGTDLKIPDRAEVNQLSGITTASYGRSLVALSECTIRIIDLPNPSVSVRFEMLGSSNLFIPLSIGDKQFSASDPRGKTVLVTAGSARTIIMSYISSEVTNIGFSINFTVLHCVNIPAIHVPYSTNSTTSTPWLPGSMVTYICVDGWVLKPGADSAIECIVDRSREIAVWNDHSNIQCMPEPWCHSPPTAIDNSTYILSGDNLTAAYQCIDGYTTNSSVSERTINCTTSDRDTTPWTWSSPPSFVCTPVECNVCPAECLNIANGRSTYSRYYYTQQLQYQCDVGYVRDDKLVECTSSGSWSAPPVCVPTTSTDTSYIAAIATVSTLAVVELCLIIAMAIYILRRDPKSLKDRQSTEAKTADTNEYEEAVSPPIRHPDDVNIAVVAEDNNASGGNGGYESLELTSRVHEYESLADI